MTLLEKYKNIYTETDKWKYYNSINSNNYPFLDERVANDFIFEYFKNGGKERVFDSSFKDGNERSVHSISTYFLGLIIEPLLKINSTDKAELLISEKITGEKEPDFIYFWFLSCLYHDYGYFIEYHKEIYSPKIYNLERICDELKIENDLLKTKHKLSFNRTTLKKYYTLCKNEYGFINHGIIGGLLLFDRLKKNYEITKKEAKENGITEAENDSFIYKNLHWSKNHETYYARVADSVISHNVWFSTDDKTKLMYTKKRLKNLIITNQGQKISFSNSLLGLLSLCDTIEPLKSFTQFKPDCILSKLSIETSTIERKIQIKVLDSCIDFKSWFRKIQDLEDWSKVKVEPNDNMITIMIIE